MGKRIMRTLLVGVLMVLPAMGCWGPSRPSEPPRDKWGRKAERPPAPPPVRHQPLDLALRESARNQLLMEATVSDPILRAQSIEAIQQVLPDVGRSIIVKSLSDGHPLVRKSAAMASGVLRIKEAYPPLVKLAEDADSHVQIAALFALHRLGDTRRTHDLEQFARSPDNFVRGDTVMVLGMLEEQSALKILRQMQTDIDPAVRLQVAEAMWRLGDQRGLQHLVAATVSGYPDDQMIALLALAEPRDRRIIQHVRASLTAEYEEVKLIAARAMGMLGSDEGYAIAARDADSSDPRQRALSALALGAIGRSDAQEMLRKLLADNAPSVRIAAAMAVLQLEGAH